MKLHLQDGKVRAREVQQRGKRKSGDSFTETKGNEAMGRFQGRQKVVDGLVCIMEL